MPLYNAKFKFTFGGRSADKIHHNELMFFLDAEPGDPRFRILGNRVGDAFKPILLPRVRCIGVVYTPALAPDMVKNDDNALITIGLPFAGTRGGTDLANALPAQGNFCARFEKDAAYGRAGRMDVRGCYTADEETTGDDLGPATIANINDPALPAFGAQLLKAFTDTDAQMALPASNKAHWDTAWRAVTSVNYVGPAERQLTRAYVSVKAATHKLFLRKVHAIQAFIRKALRSGTLLLTGGLVLAQVVKQFTDLVAEFGITEVLSYAWRTEVLPYLRHAVGLSTT